MLAETIHAILALVQGIYLWETQDSDQPLPHLPHHQLISLLSSSSSLGSASSASNLFLQANRDVRARAHAATSAISGVSNASSISSFTLNQVIVSQSSIGQQSVSGRQGLVRIVTSVGGSSARLGGTDVYLDEDLPDSVDDNDNSDNDDDNDGVGIDKDNNDDDEGRMRLVNM